MTDRDKYNTIFDNGLRHIETAKLLADNHVFGFAISHIILGMEELIKYHVMMSYFADTNLFKDKEINPTYSSSIFRNHNTKHNLIEEFQKSLSPEFSTLFLEYVFKKATNQSIDEKYSSIVDNRFKEWGNFLSSCYKEINLADNERHDFFQWLNKVKSQKLKDKGFYVNWENNKWELPTQMTEAHYQTALKYATVFLKLTEIIKNMDITDNEFIQLLNSEI